MRKNIIPNFTREKAKILEAINNNMDAGGLTLEEYAVKQTQKAFDYRDLYESERLENRKLKGVIGALMTELNFFRRQHEDLFVQAQLH